MLSFSTLTSGQAKLSILPACRNEITWRLHRVLILVHLTSDFKPQALPFPVSAGRSPSELQLTYSCRVAIKMSSEVWVKYLNYD